MAKIAAKIVKLVSKNAPVDPEVAKNVESAADAVEKQADAKEGTSLAKMAGGDAAGMVGDNVDNQYVKVSTKKIILAITFLCVCYLKCMYLVLMGA